MDWRDDITPEQLREVNEIAKDWKPEDDPLGQQYSGFTGREKSPPDFLLGKVMHHVRGTKSVYYDPTTSTLWWNPKGGMWRQVRIINGDAGPYAKLSIGMDTIKELADCE
jgi:hypothetical protein